MRTIIPILKLIFPTSMLGLSQQGKNLYETIASIVDIMMIRAFSTALKH